MRLGQVWVEDGWRRVLGLNLLSVGKRVVQGQRKAVGFGKVLEWASQRGSESGPVNRSVYLGSPGRRLVLGSVPRTVFIHGALRQAHTYLTRHVYSSRI